MKLNFSPSTGYNPQLNKDAGAAMRTCFIFRSSWYCCRAVGLSPIVGSFAVGMAVASTRVIKQLDDYVSKLEIIFAPLFFAIIGAQVDLRECYEDIV
jgi:Kef-type K+ transport system membrane component KefB